MKRVWIPATCALAAFVPAIALAASREVTLAVPGMTCPSCPVTLRIALQRLHGVRVVRSDLAHRTVKVELSDPQVRDADLLDATRNAGYASSVVKAGPR